jgi:DNA primase
VIPASFLQELLSRVDIVDVVGRHVELKRGGANFMGLCPFHGEKSPSFSVTPAKQFYYCFGCGASGDAIRFLTEHLGWLCLKSKSARKNARSETSCASAEIRWVMF